MIKKYFSEPVINVAQAISLLLLMISIVIFITKIVFLVYERPTIRYSTSEFQTVVIDKNKETITVGEFVFDIAYRNIQSDSIIYYVGTSAPYPAVPFCTIVDSVAYLLPVEQRTKFFFKHFSHGRKSH